MALDAPESPRIPGKHQGTARHTPRRNILLPALGLLCSVVLLALAWWIATPWSHGPASQATPPAGLQAGLTAEQRQAFFEQEVRPQLAHYAQRNQEAVARATAHITARFEAYRQGIAAFVADITSWGTRFGVLKRGSQDVWERWWGEPARATYSRQYVSAKFATHVFSDQDLAAVVDATLQQFRDDLHASHNTLHANVSMAWQGTTGAPGDLAPADLVTQIDQQVGRVSQQMMTDSITLGVLAFVGGNVLEQAAQNLVKMLLARVTTSLATSAVTTAAASGGATAASVAAGGTGGSALGPAGTVIGVAAGFVVGFAADWWMSKQFEAKLADQCEQLLAQVQTQVLAGSRQSPGLTPAFVDAIATLQQAETSALYAHLMERTP